MTALPGVGAVAPGRLEPEPEPDVPVELDGEEELELDELLFSSLSCCANGSLLANRLNDASWPSCTVGAPVPVEVALAVAAVGSCVPLPSVGAASVGVAPAGVVVELAATGGAEGCSRFITRGTW